MLSSPLEYLGIDSGCQFIYVIGPIFTYGNLPGEYIVIFMGS